MSVRFGGIELSCGQDEFLAQIRKVSKRPLEAQVVLSKIASQWEKYMKQYLPAEEAESFVTHVPRLIHHGRYPCKLYIPCEPVNGRYVCIKLFPKRNECDNDSIARTRDDWVKMDFTISFDN